MTGRRVLALGLGGAACALLAWRPAPPQLMWNATSSVPVGLYRLVSPADLRVGDLVAVRPSPQLADLLSARGLLPSGVPLLKPVAALPGASVCRRGGAVTIDGASVGAARERDPRGRPLPRWSGCRRLSPDQLFLMNAAVPGSFDGRYFGPTPRADILARAEPLWPPQPDRYGTDGRR